MSVERTGPEELVVHGCPASAIGMIAHAVGLPVHHLADVEQSLEHAYLRLTENSVDYQGLTPVHASAHAKGADQ